MIRPIIRVGIYITNFFIIIIFRILLLRIKITVVLKWHKLLK
jgi:hypothetical protein